MNPSQTYQTRRPQQTAAIRIKIMATLTQTRKLVNYSSYLPGPLYLTNLFQIFRNNSNGTDGESLSPRDISHLCMLAHLALLLQRVIADINAHLPRTFKLRIGEWWV